MPPRSTSGNTARSARTTKITGHEHELRHAHQDFVRPAAPVAADAPRRAPVRGAERGEERKPQRTRGPVSTRRQYIPPEPIAANRNTGAPLPRQPLQRQRSRVVDLGSLLDPIGQDDRTCEWRAASRRRRSDAAASAGVHQIAMLRLRRIRREPRSAECHRCQGERKYTRASRHRPACRAVRGSAYCSSRSEQACPRQGTPRRWPRNPRPDRRARAKRVLDINRPSPGHAVTTSTTKEPLNSPR